MPRVPCGVELPAGLQRAKLPDDSRRQPAEMGHHDENITYSDMERRHQNYPAPIARHLDPAVTRKRGTFRGDARQHHRRYEWFEFGLDNHGKLYLMDRGAHRRFGVCGVAVHQCDQPVSSRTEVIAVVRQAVRARSVKHRSD